jgi:hypothetical protein
VRISTTYEDDGRVVVVPSDVLGKDDDDDDDPIHDPITCEGGYVRMANHIG